MLYTWIRVRNERYCWKYNEPWCNLCALDVKHYCWRKTYCFSRPKCITHTLKCLRLGGGNASYLFCAAVPRLNSATLTHSSFHYGWKLFISKPKADYLFNQCFFPFFFIYDNPIPADTSAPLMGKAAENQIWFKEGEHGNRFRRAATRVSVTECW